jgi:hypothetical protein
MLSPSHASSKLKQNPKEKKDSSTTGVTIAQGMPKKPQLATSKRYRSAI